LPRENSNKWARGLTKIKKLCRFFGTYRRLTMTIADGYTKSLCGSFCPIATDRVTNAGAVLQLKNEQRKQYSYLDDFSHNNVDFFDRQCINSQGPSWGGFHPRRAREK
jgi:hypothetical protein